MQQGSTFVIETMGTDNVPRFVWLGTTDIHQSFDLWILPSGYAADRGQWYMRDGRAAPPVDLDHDGQKVDYLEYYEHDGTIWRAHCNFSWNSQVGVGGAVFCNFGHERITPNHLFTPPDTGLIFLDWNMRPWQLTTLPALERRFLPARPKFSISKYGW